jgi:hypothetical protein
MHPQNGRREKWCNRQLCGIDKNNDDDDEFNTNQNVNTSCSAFRAHMRTETHSTAITYAQPASSPMNK